MCMNSDMGMIIFGILISVIGIINMMGNVSTIHSYHRNRVKKEDYKNYGKLVGGGTLIIGLTVALTGILKITFDNCDFTYITIVGLVIGFILFVYAQFKYNKGIF